MLCNFRIVCSLYNSTFQYVNLTCPVFWDALYNNPTEFQISDGLREGEGAKIPSRNHQLRNVPSDMKQQQLALPLLSLQCKSDVENNLGRHSQHKMKTILNADNDDSMLFLDIFVIFCTEPTPPTWNFPHRKITL